MRIIDEDLCAKCRNCHRFEEGEPPWEVDATCDKGFPYKKVFHNIISECPAYEPMTPNDQHNRTPRSGGPG